MNDKDIAALMQRWEMAEAKRRRDDRKYEHAQERAEMAVMKSHDYDTGNTNKTNNKQKR